MKALCGNCLRVKVFQSYEDALGARCDCGDGGNDHKGDGFCPCGPCQATMRELESGKLEKVWGLMPGVVLKSWTPEGGAEVKK